MAVHDDSTAEPKREKFHTSQQRCLCIALHGMQFDRAAIFINHKPNKLNPIKFSQHFFPELQLNTDVHSALAIAKETLTTLSHDHHHS